MEALILREAPAFIQEKLRGCPVIEPDRLQKFYEKTTSKDVQVSLHNCLELGNGTKDIELYCDEVFVELPLGLRAHLVRHIVAQWQVLSEHQAYQATKDREASKHATTGAAQVHSYSTQFPLNEWRSGRLTPSMCLAIVLANVRCGEIDQATGELMTQEGA